MCAGLVAAWNGRRSAPRSTTTTLPTHPLLLCTQFLRRAAADGTLDPAAPCPASAASRRLTSFVVGEGGSAAGAAAGAAAVVAAAGVAAAAAVAAAPTGTSAYICPPRVSTAYGSCAADPAPLLAAWICDAGVAARGGPPAALAPVCVGVDSATGRIARSRCAASALAAACAAAAAWAAAWAAWTAASAAAAASAASLSASLGPGGGMP